MKKFLNSPRTTKPYLQQVPSLTNPCQDLTQVKLLSKPVSCLKMNFYVIEVMSKIESHTWSLTLIDNYTYIQYPKCVSSLQLKSKTLNINRKISIQPWSHTILLELIGVSLSCTVRYYNTIIYVKWHITSKAFDVLQGYIPPILGFTVNYRCVKLHIYTYISRFYVKWRHARSTLILYIIQNSVKCQSDKCNYLTSKGNISPTLLRFNVKWRHAKLTHNIDESVMYLNYLLLITHSYVKRCTTSKNLMRLSTLHYSVYSVLNCPPTYMYIHTGTVIVKWRHAILNLNLKVIQNNIEWLSDNSGLIIGIEITLTFQSVTYVKWRHARLTIKIIVPLIYLATSDLFISLICIIIQMESEQLYNSLMLNTLTRPPSRAVGYGTRLYQGEPGLEQLLNNNEITDLLAAASRRRQNEELTQLYNAKSNMSEFIPTTYGNQRKPRPYCSTCSEIELVEESTRKTIIKYHSHTSSLQYRTSMRLDRNGEYFCTTCEISPHAYKTGDRCPILLTSSTLASWQGREGRHLYPGDRLHVDQLCLPGAKIDDARQALFAEYSKCLIPIDVLVCCGLNNIMCGDSSTKIIAELSDLKAMVERWNEDNSLAVMTLPYPPKISFLDRDYYKHKEAVTVSDRTSTLNRLNPQIITLNETGRHAEFTARAPRMAAWGLRKALVPPVDSYSITRRTVGNLSAHRHGAWREDTTTNQLHLSDDVRRRSGKSTINYFARIYGFPMPPDREVLEEVVEAPELAEPPQPFNDNPDKLPQADLSDISDGELESLEVDELYNDPHLTPAITKEAELNSESWIRSHLDDILDSDSDVLVVSLLDAEEREADEWNTQ